MVWGHLGSNVPELVISLSSSASSKIWTLGELVSVGVFFLQMPVENSFVFSTMTEGAEYFFAPRSFVFPLLNL